MDSQHVQQIGQVRVDCALQDAGNDYKISQTAVDHADLMDPVVVGKVSINQVDQVSVLSFLIQFAL